MTKVRVEISCPKKFDYMLKPEALQTALNFANRYIVFKVTALKKECVPSVEEIEKFLYEWGKENKAFQKNSGFRRKLAQAIHRLCESKYEEKK